MGIVRYTWIDSCKTIGLLLVILGHGRLFPESYQQFIYSFHMPLFFVLSGLLYKYKSPKETFIHDIHRLLIPYLIINFICLVIQCGMLYLQNDLTWPMIYRRIVGVFCVACYTGDYPPVSVPTWFIITLFFARMLLSIHVSKVYREVLTIISVSIFLIIKKMDMDPWLPVDSALLAIPFITGGIFLKPFRDYKFSKNTTTTTLLIIFVLILVLIFSNKYNGLVDMSWSSYGNSIVLYYLNGFIGTFILLILCKKIPIPELGLFNELCKTVSKGALLVIGFNLMFVMVFQTVTEKILPSHTITPVIGFLVGLVILYCFYWATKFCIRFIPIMLGTK